MFHILRAWGSIQDVFTRGDCCRIGGKILALESRDLRTVCCGKILPSPGSIRHKLKPTANVELIVVLYYFKYFLLFRRDPSTLKHQQHL